jgi:hypothetical protein
MSAMVCNVCAVVLRTPGERVKATIKIRRIVFNLLRRKEEILYTILCC